MNYKRWSIETSEAAPECSCTSFFSFWPNAVVFIRKISPPRKSQRSSHVERYETRARMPTPSSLFKANCPPRRDPARLWRLSTLYMHACVMAGGGVSACGDAASGARSLKADTSRPMRMGFRSCSCARSTLLAAPRLGQRHRVRNVRALRRDQRLHQPEPPLHESG